MTFSNVDATAPEGAEPHAPAALGETLLAEDFKALFRGHPGGVAVITAFGENGPVEADRLRAIPVTTRKDFVRLPQAFRARITVLNITLAWEEPATIEALIDPLAQQVPIPA